MREIVLDRVFGLRWLAQGNFSGGPSRTAETWKAHLELLDDEDLLDKYLDLRELENNLD